MIFLHHVGFEPRFEPGVAARHRSRIMVTVVFFRFIPGRYSGPFMRLDSLPPGRIQTHEHQHYNQCCEIEPCGGRCVYIGVSNCARMIFRLL